MNDIKIEDLTKNIISAIRQSINVEKAGLHEPSIDDMDIKSVVRTLETGFVSSVGKDIEEFEKDIARYTNASYVVGMCNGTSALHISLLANNIRENDEILVPALTFIATANAISYCKAIPHFVDSEVDSFGINIDKLELYLEKNTKLENNECINLKTGRRIYAIIPVHVFGFIVDMIRLQKLARRFNLVIIEDATEALGSFRNNKHAGTFGKCGALSFNGNKIITTGGGGALITNDLKLAKYAKHLSTTAKLKHKYEYHHDEVGFNYRMPSLNAALGISQLKKLPNYIIAKTKIRDAYQTNFNKIEGLKFILGPQDCKSNYWLNSIKLDKEIIKYKDYIIEELNEHGYLCRPIWQLLSSLNPYKKNPSMDLSQAQELQESIINIPSSPKLGKMF
jgi:perosamine synthetase